MSSAALRLRSANSATSFRTSSIRAATAMTEILPQKTQSFAEGSILSRRDVASNVSTRERGNLPDSFGVRKRFWMNGPRQSIKPVEQARCRSIQKLIANAVHPPACRSGSVLPTTNCDYLFQRNAISGSTPGSHDDLGIQSQNFFF